MSAEPTSVSAMEPRRKDRRAPSPARRPSPAELDEVRALLDAADVEPARPRSSLAAKVR
jgi:hypothetical protein